ncbi:MAG: hypothetical protein EOO39_10550 [Cytophagaceae bacterium]|nr:MAG: hypothetical protein EOO39_10550 [Cytophagaceae bacterium]
MGKKRIPLDEPGYRKPRKAPDHELTVRLIESMHTTSLVLADRDLTHPKVREAIDDLFENGKLSKLTHIYVEKLKNDQIKIKL